MPIYRVLLERKIINYDWATVDIEADNEQTAIQAATALGEWSPDIDWDDQGCGFGGCEITPGEKVEIVSNEEGK